MVQTSIKTLLSAAVEALKKAGESAPIQQQIDTVGNALLGAYRKRDLDAKESGFPPEARNVLEMLRLQIYKTLNILAERQGAQELYMRLMEDLDVVGAFTDRIVKFYAADHPSTKEDESFVREIKEGLRLAREQAITNLALEKIFYAIEETEKKYRSHADMDKKDYANELENLGVHIKKWEVESAVQGSEVKSSSKLVNKVGRIKDRLEKAMQISQLKLHPSLMGEMGIKELRIAAEAMQSSKTLSEIEQAVKQALDADQKLVQGGRQFENVGRVFHLQITQHVATFVDKELRRLDAESLKSQAELGENRTQNLQYVQGLVEKVEQLASYFHLVKQWAGPHQEDLFERIVLHYEKILREAKMQQAKMAALLASNKLAEQASLELTQIALLYQKIQTMAEDLIIPSEIFIQKEI